MMRNKDGREHHSDSLTPVKRIDTSISSIQSLERANNSAASSISDTKIMLKEENNSLNMLKGYESYDGSPSKKLKRLHSTPNVSAAGLTTWKKMLESLAR